MAAGNGELLGGAGEWPLVRALFSPRSPLPPDVRVGIGDDAAVLSGEGEEDWVVATDTVTEGIHALAGDSPEALGWKAVAVNVSDLAAMGARPCHAVLAASFPSDMAWSCADSLSAGLHAALGEWGFVLVGGDTTATPGPLTLSLTLLGRLEPGRALLRSGARAGDRVYVTGTLGDSAAGLDLLREPPSDWLEAYDRLVERHRRPRPPLEFGRALAGIASAAIDISDGLAADLGRVAKASGVGIELDTARLPLSAGIGEWEWAGRGSALECAVAGGEDFELAFTAGPETLEALHRAQYATDTRFTEIGRVVPGRPGEVIAGDGRALPGGYDHFPPRGEGP